VASGSGVWLPSTFPVHQPLFDWGPAIVSGSITPA